MNREKWKAQIELLSENKEVSDFVTWWSRDPDSPVIGLITVGKDEYQVNITRDKQGKPVIYFPLKSPQSDMVHSSGIVNDEKYDPDLGLDQWLIMIFETIKRPL